MSTIMVDKGTLERIQELKQAYAIGSKQAWEYLKHMRKYEGLMLEVIRELEQEGKTCPVPPVEEIELVCHYFFTAFFNADSNYPSFDEDIAPKADYKTLLKLYCLLGSQPNRFKPDDSIRDRAERTLAAACLQRMPLSSSLDWNKVNIKDNESARLLQSKKILYGEFHFIDDKAEHSFAGVWGDGFLSGYARASLERTLNKIDVERQIARQAVLATTADGEKPKTRIFQTLKFFKKIAYESLRLSSETLFPIADVELPVRAPQDTKPSDSCIYAILRHANERVKIKKIRMEKLIRRKEAGTLDMLFDDMLLEETLRKNIVDAVERFRSDNPDDHSYSDYKFRCSTYIIRAIKENYFWLEKMLE